MKLTHFKGIPFSWPFRVRKLKKTKTFTQTFTFTKVKYDLGDDDQDDWNKLTGVKLHYFRPKKENMMVAWRWNLEKEKVQICFYWNYNGKHHWTDPLMELDEGSNLTVDITYDNYDASPYNYYPNYKITISSVGQKVRKNYLFTNKTGWLINTWFGGNRRPPNKIQIKVN